MKQKKFLCNTAILSVGSLLSKLIGGFFRIPLTSLLGGEGMGLYQLVFPFYVFLLTFCSSGVSTAVAKMVADEKYFGGKGAFLTAKKTFFLFGTLGSIFLFCLADTFSAWQKQPLLSPCFKIIAPSLVFVSLLSVYRGWYQGKNDMFPTAFSMIEENCFKAFFSIVFAILFSGDLYRRVFYVFLGITLSEGISLFSIWKNKNKYAYRLPCNQKKVPVEELLKTTVPIALSASILPFSSFIDSFLIAGSLRSVTKNSLSLYGLFSGAALTLVNIPVTVCYGVSVAIVPKIAGEQKKEEKDKNTWFSFFVTLALSSLCTVALYLFSPLAIGILFSGFSWEEKTILLSLVRSLWVSSLFLPLIQTLSACLSAKGKATFSCAFMLIAVAVKTVAILLFVNEKNGIYGAVYALNICYFIAFVLNLTGNLTLKKGEEYDHDRWTRRRRGRLNAKG